MTGEAFETVRAAGAEALLSGTHLAETPPTDGGRWGTSIVLLPTGEIADCLESQTGDCLQVLGGRHWPSGGAERAHVTIRALEPYSDSPLPIDRLDRYEAALARTAAGHGPITLDFRGLVLSVGSAMAWATCPDGSGTDFRASVARELGDDGRFEDRVLPAGRAIWYVSLVHFGETVAAPEAGIEWADKRRDLWLGRHVFTTAHVCRWAFDGQAMAPVPLAQVDLA